MKENSPYMIIRLQMEWLSRFTLSIFYLKLVEVLKVKEEQLGRILLPSSIFVFNICTCKLGTQHLHVVHELAVTSFFKYDLLA